MYFPKITLFLSLCLANCDSKTYEDYTLFRGTPRSERELVFFQNMSQYYEINYWRRPGLVDMPVDFVIGPEHRADLLYDAEDNGISLTTLIRDLQRAFDKQIIKTYIRRKLDSFNWHNYYRLDDIYSWLRDLTKLNPRAMRLLTIGKTIENRDIIGLRFSLQGFNTRPKVIIEGGVHAREWIAPSFVTYLINELVNSQKSNNSELMRVAYEYEWIFVPVLNPDGYEYTHTNDRMWRKNRRGAYGVDINRNFGIAFGATGATNDKYDDTYCGEAAFSEPESYAMAELTKANSNGLMYYVTFHSYGQYFIIPYSFTTEYLENYEEVKVMGEIAAAKLSRRYGTRYTVGNAFDTVGYLASGSSTCWVKKAFKTKYVLTVELRDTGYYGFALPPEQITPTCKEAMDGMLSFFKRRTKEQTQEDHKIALRHLALNAAEGHSVFQHLLISFCACVIKFWL